MSILATDAQHTGSQTWRRVLRWLAVAAVGLIFASALAASGSWLGWRGAGPLPGDQRAQEIAGLAAPTAKITETDRYDAIAGSRWPEPSMVLGGDDEYESGYVTVSFALPSDLAFARRALEADGWRITEVSFNDTIVNHVTARRDGVDLIVYGGGLVFQRAEPALARVLALTGWGFGLLLGGWVALKFTAAHRGRDGRIAARAGLGLLLLPTVAVIGELFFPARAIPPEVPGMIWEPYMSLPLKFLVIVGALAWAYAGARRFLTR